MSLGSYETRFPPVVFIADLPQDGHVWRSESCTCIDVIFIPRTPLIFYFLFIFIRMSIYVCCAHLLWQVATDALVEDTKLPETKSLL